MGASRTTTITRSDLGPAREYPVNLGSHDEIVLMQSGGLTESAYRVLRRLFVRLPEQLNRRYCRADGNSRLVAGSGGSGRGS
jgi:hypothetical protein